MSLTKATYSMITGAPVNVLDYGAVGDGVTDDTASIQTAIDAAQTANKILFVPAGTYKITARLDVSPSKPLYFQGEGQGDKSQKGTTFELYTTGIALFRAFANTEVEHIYENFTCVNKSGGSTESAFLTDGATYCHFRDIGIYDFQYGINGQATLWSTFERLTIENCSYGISLWKTGGTPPYQLNIDYYNNVLAIRDCHIRNCTLGIRVAGASVAFDTVDVSGFTTYGIQLGSSDFNNTAFTANNLYFESGGVGTAVFGVNAFGTFGSVFFGQGYTTAFDLTNCRVNIESAVAYAAVTTLVSNAGSSGKVSLGYVVGTITNQIVNSGGASSFTQNAGLSAVRTYTVKLRDAQSGGNVSPTTVTGYYNQIGNQVTVSFWILNIDTTGLTAGNILYIDLPIASSNIPTFGAAQVNNFTLPANTSNVTAFSQGSTSTFYLRADVSGGAYQNLTVAALASGTARIGVTLTYFV